MRGNKADRLAQRVKYDNNNRDGRFWHGLGMTGPVRLFPQSRYHSIGGGGAHPTLILYSIIFSQPSIIPSDYYSKCF